MNQTGFLLLGVAFSFSLVTGACTSDPDGPSAGAGGTGGEESTGGSASGGGSMTTGGNTSTGAASSTGGAASGGVATGGAPGGAGEGPGGLGGQLEMGGLGQGGAPAGDADLVEACAALCETTTTLSCEGNEDIVACEQMCAAGATAGCESEWLELKQCEAKLSGDGFLCVEFFGYSFIALAEQGLELCEGVYDAEADCVGD